MPSRIIPHALVVPLTAVGRTTTDNQLRLVLQSQTLHLVVIDATSLLIQIIAYGLVEDTRGVDE